MKKVKREKKESNLEKIPEKKFSPGFKKQINDSITMIVIYEYIKDVTKCYLIIKNVWGHQNTFTGVTLPRGPDIYDKTEGEKAALKKALVKYINFETRNMKTYCNNTEKIINDVEDLALHNLEKKQKQVEKRQLKIKIK